MEQMLLTPKEAAQVIQVGRSTMYRLVGAGKVPHVRIGTSIRVPVEGLRAWVKANSEGGAVVAVVARG